MKKVKRMHVALLMGIFAIATLSSFLAPKEQNEAKIVTVAYDPDDPETAAREVAEVEQAVQLLYEQLVEMEKQGQVEITPVAAVIAGLVRTAQLTAAVVRTVAAAARTAAVAWAAVQNAVQTAGTIVNVLTTLGAMNKELDDSETLAKIEVYSMHNLN